MNTSNGNEPRKVIIKMMTVNRGVDDVFNFFENIKNMEIGGAIKSVTKGDDGWWTFEHIVSGKSKIRSRTNREFGILDHVFVGGGIEWNVYARVVPNQKGSTTTWTFIRPDRLSDEDFESQLKGYDLEIAGWTRVLTKNRFPLICVHSWQNSIDCIVLVLQIQIQKSAR